MKIYKILTNGVRSVKLKEINFNIMINEWEISKNLYLLLLYNDLHFKSHISNCIRKA